MPSNSFCPDHTKHCSEIEDIKKEYCQQDKRIFAIEKKLNQILGGVILSPFLVALIMLLLKAPK